jgi:hypothetical protein
MKTLLNIILVLSASATLALSQTEKQQGEVAAPGGVSV